MAIDVQKFVGGVISVVISVVIAVVVAIPILSSNQVADTVTNHAAINSMISIIPLLIIVGVIISVVGMFLYNKKN